LAQDFFALELIKLVWAGHMDRQTERQTDGHYPFCG